MRAPSMRAENGEAGCALAAGPQRARRQGITHGRTASLAARVYAAADLELLPRALYIISMPSNNPPSRRGRSDQRHRTQRHARSMRA